jgi:lysophospholipase L1-like esterase
LNILFKPSNGHAVNTYLALGDSYTIGEQVPITCSFPYRLMQQLREAGVDLAAPEIVAVTGYTGSELEALMAQHRFSERYDFVTLLIGVNNQYRGQSVEEFAPSFHRLLAAAIGFAADRPERVFVISIPDWGQTPFAKERDVVKIGEEIDAYNLFCREASETAGVLFTDITTSQRMNAHDAARLAPDLLHPSAVEYADWAHALFPPVLNVLK